MVLVVVDTVVDAGKRGCFCCVDIAAAATAVTAVTAAAGGGNSDLLTI